MNSFPFIPFVLHTIVAPQVSVATVGVNSLPKPSYTVGGNAN